MSAQSLNISALHLGETEQKILHVAVRLLQEDEFACQLLGDSDCTGHIVVLDMDSDAAAETLQKLRSSQIKILLADEQRSDRNLVSLAKPVHVETLRFVLGKVCKQLMLHLQKTYDEIVQPAEFSQPTEIASEVNDAEDDYEEEESSLLLVMLEARDQKKCVKIEEEGMPTIYIDGNKSTIASEMDYEHVLEVGLHNNEHHLHKSEFGEKDVDTAADDISLSSLDNFLWELTLKSSENILPDDIDLDTPIKLKAWPNFTRHGFHPDNFKIAALLARQPNSQRNLIEATGLGEEVISRFINSCYAVGLIEVQNDENPVEVPEKRQISEERSGLFRRLAMKLGIA